MLRRLTGVGAYEWFETADVSDATLSTLELWSESQRAPHLTAKVATALILLGSPRGSELIASGLRGSNEQSFWALSALDSMVSDTLLSRFHPDALLAARRGLDLDVVLPALEAHILTLEADPTQTERLLRCRRVRAECQSLVT